MWIRRLVSRTMRTAQWFCVAVFIFAAANWTLNLCHVYWKFGVWRVEMGTWLGSMEFSWRSAQMALPKPSGFFGHGGITGVNGIFTVMHYMVWLPSAHDDDNFTTGANSLRSFTGLPGWGRTTVIVPDWMIVFASGAPIVWIVWRERRRRGAKLCPWCEYSLVGLTVATDGQVTCPECGHRSVSP